MTLAHYLVFGAILFAISVVGIFLNRRNVIVLLMAIELMLLAVNTNFIAFSNYLGDYGGQIFVFFILTVAAAESAIGLAILVLLFRNLDTINVEDLDQLQGVMPVFNHLSIPMLVAIPLAPLVGAIVAGFFGKAIGRANAHRITILGVLIAFVLSAVAFFGVLHGGRVDETLYTWAVVGDPVGGIKFEVGFLVDSLTATMMLVVTFVSLMVHIYTIGYMVDDPGYQRFFAYISLFTFSMLMLVMSNNMLQLFFGWEAVGLVSYLLIGFWYTKPTAIYANLKAFLVNRVGDFGFILGIGLLLAYTGTMHYGEVFAKGEELSKLTLPGTGWMLLTPACICLFIGAMGKSAQFPLHVWLPDSMEGPTPISALIHAATMVTAGIFMVARFSPLFELSDAALSFVIVIGSITALFMGFLGVIQNDIKRVVAYSTLSQLGYMTVALGASAYSAAIFHLMTHAFFKALLFLAAGSVIIGMHHDQDIRNMGGVRKYMPITWITSLIGSLALIGTPFFSGFYSKDSIIEAVAESHIAGSGFAYFAVIASVFVTALYSFRMYFLVFHGKERFGLAHDAHAAPALDPSIALDPAVPLMTTNAIHPVSHDDVHHAADDTHAHDDPHDEHHGLAPGEKPHETGWVITLPLVLLAIPSLLIGFFTIGPMLYGDWFKGAIFVGENHHAMEKLAEEFHGALGMALHGVLSLPFWLALSGVVVAWYLYLVNPKLTDTIQAKTGWLYKLLDNKYYLDRFNEIVFAGGARRLGGGLWKRGDQSFIDGFLVNGSARFVGWFASVVRTVQSGYIYHYAFAMIIGVLALMSYFVLRQPLH